MNLFESKSLLFDISTKEAMKRLDILTRRHLFDRSKFHSFKGLITTNSFRIRPSDGPEIIAIVGHVEKVEPGKTRLSVSGKIVWSYLLANLALFITSSFTLFFLAFLLIKQDMLYGTLAILSSSVLVFFLYNQLIGRIRQNYRRSILVIEDAFNQKLT